GAGGAGQRRAADAGPGVVGERQAHALEGGPLLTVQARDRRGGDEAVAGVGPARVADVDGSRQLEGDDHVELAGAHVADLVGGDHRDGRRARGKDVAGVDQMPTDRVGDGRGGGDRIGGGGGERRGVGGARETGGADHVLLGGQRQDRRRGVLDE